MSTREEVIAACERFLAKERLAWMVIAVSDVDDNDRRWVSVADPNSPKDRELLLYVESTGQVKWIQSEIDIHYGCTPDEPYVRPCGPLTPEQAAAACLKVFWFEESRTRATCVGRDADTGEWLVELRDLDDKMHILVRFNDQTGAAKILRRLWDRPGRLPGV